MSAPIGVESREALEARAARALDHADFWEKRWKQQADRSERLYRALREVERHCPCGARPESLTTHPHVGGCPVGEALWTVAPASVASAAPR